jgi:ubiquinone/menaquinone biosynthesis C-methylase UbiE
MQIEPLQIAPWFRAPYSWAYRVLAEQAAKGSGDSRCLDLGCGRGLHSFSLAQMGFTVEGVDTDSARIDRARQEAGRLNGLKTQFHLKDALEFLKAAPTASYDCIFMSGVLYYFPDPLAALTEMKRVLKPGGVIVDIETNRECLPVHLLRKLKFHLKHRETDLQTLNHLLGKRFLQTVCTQFPSARYRPFDLLNPIAAFLPLPAVLRAALSASLSRLDWVLLGCAPRLLWPFAFKWGLIVPSDLRIVQNL